MISNKDWPSPKARKGLSIWRVNRIYALIISKMSAISNEPRKMPFVWSIMHMFSTTQIGKLLALKRGLDPELAALTCAFHDIYSFFTGKHKDHGLLAEKIIREIVEEYNTTWRDELAEITPLEVDRMVNAIVVHSDKVSVSDDPLAELLKDADTLDSYLDGFTQDTESTRIQRVNKVFKEFAIDHEIPQ
ncbi:MAG: HD domain-containing protein [Candidatus Heimdallarchaeota archaeon]